MKPALEECLEILLVTYNRGSYLERTLGQLLHSPFRGCRLTVLDNHSTDDTPGVCGRFEKLFPAMTTMRHRVNVGAGPNYLRAVELATSRYTWVLADDDTFDFSSCDDAIDAVRSGEFDLISLGAPHQHDWERGLSATTGELVARGARYFHTYSFVPGVVFRTELFDSECVALGYRNVANLYPQFPFLLSALRRDFLTYSARDQIVCRNEEENATSGLRWLVAWARSCATIDNPALRRRAVYEIWSTRPRWLLGVSSMIAYERRLHPDRVWPEMRALLASTSGGPRLAVALLSPLALIPPWVYRRVTSLWRTARRQAPVERGPSDDELRR